MTDKTNKPDYLELKELALKTLGELETDYGILASGRNELFGCLFGRDSLITALKLLQAYRYEKNPYYLALTKKIIANLAALQGKNDNIESGEQPGKIIHEYRIDNHERLTARAVKPWYIYSDGTMRNYDSLDATPLFLIAAYRYWQYSGDNEFIQNLLAPIKAALLWIDEYGDTDNDNLIDYRLDPGRNHGGLICQNWMDSTESLFHDDGTPPVFPVAPAEAQGYAYMSLRLWARFFRARDGEFSVRLTRSADRLKASFIERFIVNRNNETAFASNVDSTGPMITARSNIGHLLWSCLNKTDDGGTDCIVPDAHIPALVKRILSPDLYEPKAGIRTLSRLSGNFDPRGYHNGSIWPHDNSLIAEGLDNLSYHEEARRLRRAVLDSLYYFKTPVELYAFDNNRHQEYVSRQGQSACRQQAWSAAAMLSDALKEINRID
ncbi:hypothetical protein A2303_06670 [Candidatus Falkowbacteria bacterium RIFOXYB2_FULL_47_14]|uniref:Mannosylglycerate hydrolase MGH1-like glycoside hydrolase domain-containing protein n=1 Tax=Candidatus Falkowbacteria bacterium RIFOXYA2_FULL_47_19 TaxID=1797994 RepID=A0A1F5SG75_9BACT|nr:MAG: hypothetical protein A2227_00415 [Candidatus Falkowbacteria bacterium RIFOXYA2_FULL_47_19]OGF35535.1 MAG: hypothetical protein A2468_05860 [Candidatus Falkowbacteria bacterium RIFOXYC2_FULL_46_15]OGF43556.1 MAG: hypothetical protein A2303_06670 [Candidatus Falkowbacteria bacterium RIFOXYB2_FULL_47_14]